MNAKNYYAVRAEAQQLANDAARANPEYARKGGCDWGLERNAFGFTIFRLPLPQNRYGHELRCEVVSPEVWS